MVFLNLRQREVSIQALLVVAPEKVSKQMAKWAASLLTESIVLVEGVSCSLSPKLEPSNISQAQWRRRQKRSRVRR